MHCGRVLQQTDQVFQLPPAWLPLWEPMTNYREATFHVTCWPMWQYREQFIERVNATDSGYRFAEDDSWSFVGDDGPI